jgi:hypothetical protein
MKMFVIPCRVNEKLVPIQFFLGEPTPGIINSLHFQTAWLRSNRGVEVPAETLFELAELRRMTIEHNAPFSETCAYALNFPSDEELPVADNPVMAAVCRFVEHLRLMLETFRKAVSETNAV